MREMMSRMTLAMVFLVTMLVASACNSAADVASSNLSKAAENFEIERRIVFFNGITDTYLLSIEGRCSIEADSLDKQLEVTCKVDDNRYLKHFLGLSDNVSYFVEQLGTADVSEYRYRVFFRPQEIAPDIDVQTGGG